MNLFRRTVALLLCLVLCFSMLPVMVLADEEEQEPEITSEEIIPVEEPVEEPTEEPTEKPTEEPAEEVIEEVTAEPVEDTYALLKSNDILTGANYKDENLLAALKEQFPDGLTSEEAATVDELLYLSNRGISNLDGLEYFSGLTTLNVPGNKLTSVPTEFSPIWKILMSAAMP